MRCILAIDIGGTKSEALAVSDDGDILGWGRCGFADPGSGTDISRGSGRSMESIRSAACQALGSIRFDELHIVDYYGVAMPSLPLDDAGTSIVHHRVRERDGLLELAGQDHGVLASAGTGVFVEAVARDGRTLHLDALGPLLGDYGGAYPSAPWRFRPRRVRAGIRVIKRRLRKLSTPLLGSRISARWGAPS